MSLFGQLRQDRAPCGEHAREYEQAGRCVVCARAAAEEESAHDQAADAADPGEAPRAFDASAALVEPVADDPAPAIGLPSGPAQLDALGPGDAAAPKRPRKARSDRGVPRGPRRPRVPVTAETSASGDIPPLTPARLDAIRRARSAMRGGSAVRVVAALAREMEALGEPPVTRSELADCTRVGHTPIASGVAECAFCAAAIPASAAAPEAPTGAAPASPTDSSPALPAGSIERVAAGAAPTTDHAASECPPHAEPAQPARVAPASSENAGSAAILSPQAGAPASPSAHAVLVEELEAALEAREATCPGTPAWHRARRSSIGSSEIAAVCGIDPRRGPIDVYAAKVGLVEESADNDFTERGRRLEPAVADWYAAEVDMAVRPVAGRAHPEIAYFAATPDREREDGRLVEVKTVASFMRSEWGEPGTDEIPLHYLAQVQWQLFVFEREVADVAALIDLNLRIYTVRADRDVQANLAAAGHRFWAEHVLPQIAPALTDSDGTRAYLRARWPRPGTSLPPATTDVRDEVARYERAHREIAAFTRIKKTAGNVLADLIGTAGAEGFDLGNGDRVTWKANAKGARSLYLSTIRNDKEIA